MNLCYPTFSRYEIFAYLIGVMILVNAQVISAQPQAEEDTLTAEEMKQINEALGVDASSDQRSSSPQLVGAGRGAILSSSPLTTSRPRGAQVGGSSLPLELSIILDAALAAFSVADRSGPAAQIGAHDPRENGFNLQQLEMHLASNVDQLFRLESNIVYAQFGVEVEEAYLKTLSLAGGLQARVGQMLTRFGRINPTHPHSWSFLDQPLILGKLFGSEGNRGIGAELSWLTPLPWMAELLVSLTDSRGGCCMRSYLGGEGATRELRGVQDLTVTSSLKQFWTLHDDWGLLFGVSYQGGANASGPSNRSEIAGADLNIRFRPRAQAGAQSLTLQVEWMARRRQYPRALLVDHGGYSSLVYEWTRQWSAGARWEWVGGLEDDPLDPLWDQPRQRTAGQLTYRPSHFSRIRLQVNRDDPPNLPAFYSAFLGFEGVIGAHGAHDY